MYYSNFQVTFQEIPDEISLLFSISGCRLRCVGCHSASTWSATYGEELTLTKYDEFLKKYKNMATCVLFLGGEWDEKLVNYLKIAHNEQFKTGLYTGMTLNNFIQEHSNLIYNLDFLKTEPWIRELGGLDSNSTNQRFFQVEQLPESYSLTDLTHKFKQQEL